jgi:hypothetical protein|tara:strand:+ start:1680 stop:2354 length:675 start_codon:yes stop_codon:yes gene_type:complete
MKVMHALTVDNLVFGCKGDHLEILLIRHGDGYSIGQWGLPGDWLLDHETLSQAAARVLLDKTGLSDIYLEQLRTFSDLDRYPTDRIITTAFISLIAPEAYELVVGAYQLDVKWFPVSDIPKLIFDHEAILEAGIVHLKHKVCHEPIGFNLLPEKFSLLELQTLYEAILGVSLDKPNFRRKMKKMNLLITCNEKQSGVAHRAAALYRFDKERYFQLKKQGFVFEV